jgi:hypothetical protein
MPGAAMDVIIVVLYKKSVQPAVIKNKETTLMTLVVCILIA